MGSSHAPLTLNETKHGSWVVIEVVGDLDLATAPQLVEVMEGYVGVDRQAVAFDLTGVRFIDSSGLRAMLEIRKSESTELMLVSPSEVVADLLELTKLADAFDVVSSVHDLVDT
jgi:anti-sigma B factor antagonist